MDRKKKTMMLIAIAAPTTLVLAAAVGVILYFMLKPKSYTPLTTDAAVSFKYDTEEFMNRCSDCTTECSSQDEGTTHSCSIGSTADGWMIVSAEDGYYYIANASGEGRLVDQEEDSPTESANFTYPLCFHSNPDSSMDADLSLWTFLQVSDTDFQISNKKTGRYIIVCPECDGETTTVRSGLYLNNSRPEEEGIWTVAAV
jgi:hypothetical protein